MTTVDEAAGLRAVPPRDFVRARTALAAKLEKNGKIAEARQVRRLPRPSPVVWALNNSASGSGEISALADAVSHLRRAQLGQGELRPAMERLRAAIAPILRRAVERLEGAGVRTSPALERRLHDTLVASVADRRLRGDLAAGRLTEERGAAGFDMLTEGPIPAASRRGKSPNAKSPPPPAPRLSAPKKPTPAERRRQRRAEREAREAARRAHREAKALEKVAHRKAQAAEAAAAKVEALRAALLEQERRAADLQRAADAAREAVRTANSRATP